MPHSPVIDLQTAPKGQALDALMRIRQGWGLLISKTDAGLILGTAEAEIGMPWHTAKAVANSMLQIIEKYGPKNHGV